MSTSNEEKPKVTIEDLPVPLKELTPEEQEEVKGGMATYNPSTPTTFNPTLIKKPSTDQY
jgi:hypothetical protein